METEQAENTLATRTEVDDLLDLRASYLHTIDLLEKENCRQKGEIDALKDDVEILNEKNRNLNSKLASTSWAID